MRRLTKAACSGLLLLSSCSSLPREPQWGQGITLESKEETDNAMIYHLAWDSPRANWHGSQAVAIVPKSGLPGPGVLYFHLLGAGGDWQEFQEEALQATTRGVRSVLINGNVPWNDRFMGDAQDRVLMEAQMSDLRRCVDILTHLPGTDLSRLAFVGHDYGAMYGVLLSAEETPIHRYALIALAPTWDSWINYFQRDRALTKAYPALMKDLDPVTVLAKPTTNERWIQFSNSDQYITADDRRSFAGLPATIIDTLDSNHVNVAADGAATRLKWLYAPWGLRVPGSDLIDTVEVKGPMGRFLIGRTEVTQAQWKAVTGSSPSWFPGPNRPVEMVRWPEAVAFCNRLSRLEGLPEAYAINEGVVTLIPGSTGWRLPSSAEWEWAAQGGAEGKKTLYAGSNDLNEVGWNYENAGQETHDVAQKKPNELGLFDMTGNVREWCFDNGADETTRIYRGGGILSDAKYCRVDYSDDFLSTYLNNDNGLRVVRSLPR